MRISQPGSFWQKRTHLSQSSLTDESVQSVHMRRQVHVQEETVLDLVHEFQADGVLGLVELEQDVTYLRLEFKERLE